MVLFGNQQAVDYKSPPFDVKKIYDPFCIVRDCSTTDRTAFPDSFERIK